MSGLDLDERLYREGIQLAPIEKRALAHVIDDFILSVLMFVIISESISGAETPEEIIVAVNSLIFEFMFVKFIYHAIFTSIYGGSLGKIFLKIKVINTYDFSEIGILDSLNRALVRMGSEAIFLLGFLWAVFDENRQGWHDKSSNTIVVNSRK
jgi:uncharacterized RDD family membrane protein YckC